MHHNTGRPHPHPHPWPATPAQADACPPEPVNLAGRRIRRKQVLGNLNP
jgi:hypothetical protein